MHQVHFPLVCKWLIFWWFPIEKDFLEHPRSMQVDPSCEPMVIATVAAPMVKLPRARAYPCSMRCFDPVKS